MENSNKNIKDKSDKELLSEEEQKKNREYEISDMPFTDTGKEPGNPELQKTFDEQNESQEKDIEDDL